MSTGRNRVRRGIDLLTRKPGATVAFVGGAVGGLSLLGLGLALAQKDPVSRCSNHDAIGPPLNLVFVGLCAASFLAGGLLSDFDEDAVEDAPGSEGDRKWLQTIVVAVLAILFGLLTYETYSLALIESNQLSNLWPITYFVRCLSIITTPATIGSLVVVCIMCAFFGKWLWYRPRTLNSGPTST